LVAVTPNVNEAPTVADTFVELVIVGAPVAPEMLIVSPFDPAPTVLLAVIVAVNWPPTDGLPVIAPEMGWIDRPEGRPVAE